MMVTSIHRIWNDTELEGEEDMKPFSEPEKRPARKTCFAYVLMFMYIQVKHHFLMFTS